ncbi:MAG TPA: membrane protein, partial [Pseudonocardia sp.]
FGGKIGYDARLDVALSQVFGPGAATGVTPAPTAGATAPATGTPASSAQLQGAASDINAALDRLRAAQRSGDYTAQGGALADLDKAITQFQTAEGAPPNPH